MGTRSGAATSCGGGSAVPNLSLSRPVRPPLLAGTRSGGTRSGAVSCSSSIKLLEKVPLPFVAQPRPRASLRAGPAPCCTNGEREPSEAVETSVSKESDVAPSMPKPDRLLHVFMLIGGSESAAGAIQHSSTARGVHWEQDHATSQPPHGLCHWYL